VRDLPSPAQHSGPPAVPVLTPPPHFVKMATKKGRTEIPDSEDEPMTSSPIEDDTGKLPANSSDSQRLAFQTRLQYGTSSHQATVDHVPDTVSNRAENLVIEQEDPLKDVEMANTMPDNPPQQHVTVEATSEEAMALRKPDISKASWDSEQPDGSTSRGQPLGQSVQQKVDQGTGIDVEGASKPTSLHIDVPVSAIRKMDSAPSKEVEVGEKIPEQVTISDLPGSEELENTSTDKPDIPPKASVNLTETEVAGQEAIDIDTFSDPTIAHVEPTKQDQPDKSHAQEMANSASTQEPGSTTATTHVPPAMKERHAEKHERMDIDLPNTDVEQLPLPESSGHEAPVQDAEATLNVDLKRQPDPPDKQSEAQDLETNQLPQPQVPSPTKGTSGSDKPSPVKGSQEATVAELRAQRAALIASLAALPNVQELIAEIEDDDDSSRGPYDGPTDTEVTTAANKIVKTHIELLHEYNEMKDVGQGLMGLIADSRGVRIVEVQDEFGIDAKD
jgi:hypothetical protein